MEKKKPKRKPKGAYAVALLAVGLMAGCTASQRYQQGLNKGYNDAVAFQNGAAIAPGKEVGYLDGWRKAYTQEDILARYHKFMEAAALQKQKELDEQQRLIEERKAQDEARRVLHEKLKAPK